MDTKKVTNWFNWLVFYNFFCLIFALFEILLFFFLLRQEWKSVVDDAYNEDRDVNCIRRAFSTIVAWETR